MIVLRGKLVENRPLDVVRDAWRTITRNAYRAVGLYWVEKFLPRHFEPGAGQRYGYQFRTRAYQLRKDRQLAAGRPISKGGAPVVAGSDTPLVLTGYMKREVMQSNVVRGFPTRATVILYGPQYLSTRFYKKRQPDKAKELTTVRGDEREELAKVLRKELLAGINAYRGTKTTE